MLKNILDPDTFAGTVCSDTRTAFLLSDLKPNENIYIRRPTGVTDEILLYIVQLKKCLYGLPQASKYFDEHLSSQLLDMGAIRCVSDADMFIFLRDPFNTFRHCLLAATPGSKLPAFVTKEFKKSFLLTTSIEPTKFVGLVLHRDRNNKSIAIT